MGANGLTGSVGGIGATGATGAVGGIGGTGTTGATGATGAAGAVGTAGSNGLTGATGSTGATGLSGTAGSNGLTGATGAIGAQGSSGLTGAAGSSGVTGAKGATGATGPSATNGLTGATGATGAVGVTGSCSIYTPTTLYTNLGTNVFGDSLSVYPTLVVPTALNWPAYFNQFYGPTGTINIQTAAVTNYAVSGATIQLLLATLYSLDTTTQIVGDSILWIGYNNWMRVAFTSPQLRAQFTAVTSLAAYMMFRPPVLTITTPGVTFVGTWLNTVGSLAWGRGVTYSGTGGSISWSCTGRYQWVHLVNNAAAFTNVVVTYTIDGSAVQSTNIELPDQYSSSPLEEAPFDFLIDRGVAKTGTTTTFTMLSFATMGGTGTPFTRVIGQVCVDMLPTSRVTVVGPWQSEFNQGILGGPDVASHVSLGLKQSVLGYRQRGLSMFYIEPPIALMSDFYGDGLSTIHPNDPFTAQLATAFAAVALAPIIPAATNCVQGPIGANGIVGATGATGPTGPTGPPTVPPLSTILDYQFWTFDSLLSTTVFTCVATSTYFMAITMSASTVINSVSFGMNTATTGSTLGVYSATTSLITPITFNGVVGVNSVSLAGTFTTTTAGVYWIAIKYALADPVWCAATTATTNAGYTPVANTLAGSRCVVVATYTPAASGTVFAGTPVAVNTGIWVAVK